MWQRIISVLIPREDHFFTSLEQQACLAHKASLILTEYLSGKPDGVAIRDRVRDVEHQADDVADALLIKLGQTFVTPIDREDIQRLSKKLDDICDYINLAARACVVFNVGQPTRPMLVLIEKLEACTRNISEAMPALRKRDFGTLVKVGQEVRDIERDCDSVFRDELSRLFHDEAIDAKTILREREVLEDLEVAVNRCEQVAATLTNIAVKHA